jgi:hypothetical protein
LSGFGVGFVFWVMKGSHMRHVNKTLLSGSILLTAMMATPWVGAALAQGEEVVEAEIVEAGEAEAFVEPVECEEGADCEMGEAEAAPEAAPEMAPEAPVAESAPAEAEGVVLAAPGSTDESNPGGTTRPGTTPDD